MNEKEKPILTRRSFLGVASLSSLSLGIRVAGAQPGPRPAPKPIRIGIVGGGFGVAFDWHRHPDCQVTAVCDLRQDRQRRLAEHFSCPNVYKDFRELLKHPELDAVGVFTPAPLHVYMAVEAMKSGKHVISAVPAGMSVEELEQLLSTVRSTGLKYMMAETSYYRQPIITCREWARQGKFGTIFYAESEYHHEGLINIMFDSQGFPTWRYGYPPMLYPTHCTGMIIPVMQERLVGVTANGWGDGHEVLRTNQYKNPFWNETAFFKTSQGHSARASVYWHVAAGETERASFYGDRLSYIMQRPEGSPHTVVRIAKKIHRQANDTGYSYAEGEIESEVDTPNYLERLPEPLRIRSAHDNSHSFLVHEFVSAIVEDRSPAVNAWEAVAYTLPGIIAHESAMRNGEFLKIKDYGSAPS